MIIITAGALNKTLFCIGKDTGLIALSLFKIFILPLRIKQEGVFVVII
jgi:hypothetical protein